MPSIRRRAMPVRLETMLREGTISDAISEGFSEIQSLRDEITEWKDNMEEKMSSTDKYQQVSECADTLDEIADSEDDCLPPIHAEDAVKWVTQKKKSKKSPYPRWLRMQNAVNALEAAKDALTSLVEEEDSDLDEDDKLGLQEYIDKIEEVIDTGNGVEFPGMFG
jgi:hypothetical protein